MIISSIVLNGLVVAFLIGSVLVEKLVIDVRGLLNQKIRYLHILSLITIAVSFYVVFSLLLEGTEGAVQVLIFSVFSFSLLLQSFLLSLRKSLAIKVVALGVTCAIVLYHLFDGSFVSRNVLLLASLAWTGPFLKKIGFLNLKIFVILSVLWFVYDILYVKTVFAFDVFEATRKSSFSLSIIVPPHSLGSADLLWANFFVTLCRNIHLKVMGMLLLVVSNLAISMYTITEVGWGYIPLLVVWVPIGLAFMLVTHHFDRDR